MAQFPFIPSTEARDLGDDLRDVFDDLDAALQPEQRAHSGECHPALDVVETADAVEIVVDVSGIPAEALRVLFRAGVVIVAGEKAPGVITAEPTFHLVEREFGRFARAVRLTGAFDPGQARASLSAGELTIVLPRLSERRGQAHAIAITPGRP